MMLYPPVAELVDKIGSRYQLVNLVAKRAKRAFRRGRGRGNAPRAQRRFPAR